jgi:uncharacterized protein YyaL (SSP411 family)
MPNRLIHSASPYLLQHANNPVDWYEWGTEALAKAKQEQKPILVSIGYSACHWCHVMENESFENQAIAELMNEHLVCIKIDREERPDIDQIYMEAVQAMGINGGWPLNVFLTPEQKPFYGGTYFPPKNWAQLISSLAHTFKIKREEINASADELTNHLNVNDLHRFAKQNSIDVNREDINKMVDILSSRFDRVWGGLDKSPKFVMPSIWHFLLKHYAISTAAHKQSIEMVELTLNKIHQGGIYDQLGGGFSRYSVDGEWFAPHFEKMLYDNAQLLSLYSEAYLITKNNDYKKVVYKTADWLRDEMTHNEGGLFSALDADSEGVEGKFYTWTYDELTGALEDKSSLLPEYFHATEEGNWEHGRNILIRSEDDARFANDYNITKHDLEMLVEQGKQKLIDARSKRIRPGLDDKIICSWNAMAIKGLLDAYNAFGDKQFLHFAQGVINFIENKLTADGKVFRTFKNKRSTTEGFLEDYAFLIQAYIALYQATFDESYLYQAQVWCEYTLVNFFDQEQGFFHFTSSQAEPLIARKKEIFDNIIPASNSVMAQNLYHLGILLDNADWKNKAEMMAKQLSSVITQEPGYMSNWGILLEEIVQGVAEVVIVGPNVESIRTELMNHHLPYALVLGTTKSSTLPLFEGREANDDKTKIYVCFDKTCQLPVETADEAIAQITRTYIYGAGSQPR